MKKNTLIISCEHGVNTIPGQYAPIFKDHQDLLNSHKGIDFGALELANALAETFTIHCIQAQVSRLLIDCNRSLTHRDCFSEISKTLAKQEKQQIIHQYYLTYRNKVEQRIQQNIDSNHQVWHLSIHSFTPIFNNVLRNTDIGLLYDPRSDLEKSGAKQLKILIQKRKPFFRVHMNYPYKGISNGFTTELRKKFSANQYLGLEIEINQTLTFDVLKFAAVKEVFISSVQELFNFC